MTRQWFISERLDNVFEREENRIIYCMFDKLREVHWPNYSWASSISIARSIWKIVSFKYGIVVVQRPEVEN